MKEIKLKGTTVELYDNIEDLPIRNYNLLNEYALLDYEIGSTLQDIDKRFQRMDTFLVNSKLPEAIQERKNLHQTFWNAMNGTNFPALQFGCMISSVNGKPVTDYTKEGIERLINELSDKGLKQGIVKEATSEVKKKSGSNYD